MMNMLLRRLMSRGLVMVLGLGAFAYVVWRYGALLRFGDWAPLSSPVSRIIVIVLVFAIWGGIKAFRAWRDKRKSEQISQELADSPAGQDPGESRSAEEMAELRERFDQALKTLKKGKGGKGSSLYALPWYVIIGPPGSGKTTLLVNSGLEFPLAESLGQSKIEGIGGTRYCDWWFTDEAVLIDTAGRYTTQDSDESVDNRAWLGFLKLLKKHRKRRPINGIVLAISMDDLLRQGSSERERHASAISERIQELYEHLGVRFPIYVMFTKCDLLAGFMEFYADLDRSERAQVWGFTFDLGADPTEAFGRRFDQLQAQLEARLLDRMQNERDVQRRELIYDFPLQFAASREAVGEFLQKVFKPSRFRETPLLRGVYFTSGTQEGTPFNRIMSQLANTFSLSRSATQSRPSQGKAFFIRDLMQKVIFRESGLAGANLRVERMYRMAGYAALGLLIAIPLLLNIAWFFSHGANKRLIQEVGTETEALSDEIAAVPDHDPSLLAVLPLMNQARDLPMGYSAQQGGIPLGRRWGLYQGHRLGKDGTIPAYQRILENGLLPRLMVRMEQDLRDSMSDPNDAYQALKAYLMLANPDKMDVDYVRDYVRDDWDDNLARVLSNQQLEDLRGHLDALLEMDPLSLPFDLDRNLVSNVRVMLSRTTLAERIYNVIKGDKLGEGQQQSIANMAGPRGPRVFIRESGAPVNSGVPALFSPEGYRNMYLPLEQQAIERVRDEAWIYATEADDATAVSEERLTNDIRRLYLEDYVREWVDFLEDVRIIPFTDLPQAAAILLILSEPDSPLKELLVNVSEATRLAPDQVVVAGAEGQSLRSRLESIFGLGGGSEGIIGPEVVDRSFAGLHNLTDAEGDRTTPIDGLLSDLDNLYRYVEQLSQSSQDNLRASMQNQADTALSQVRQAGQRMPSPISDWVMGLAGDSRNLISSEATSAVKLAWSANVAPFCRQALNDRYPFSPDATREVLLQDFGRFFSPGGILDQFINEYLRDYVDTTAATWRVKPSLADNIEISPTSLRYLQQAKEIQSAFFASGGNLPSVRFEMRPVRMDASGTLNFMLNIHGQTTSYDFGPITGTMFTWPGEGAQNQASFQFSPPTASGRSGQSFDGPWAWFRMLDEYGLEPGVTPETFRTTFTLDDRWAEYEIRASSAFNPFDLRALRTFRCPAQL